MAKVIGIDNLGRDYEPEYLVTVSISEEIAEEIANCLNKHDNQATLFEVVEDEYSLNLESMYDITDVEKPKDFVSKHLGLNAIVNDKNLDLTTELLNNKSNEELLALMETLNTILVSRR